MASRQATVDSLLDQMSGAGTVSVRRMFGEFGLYSDGKLFGLVCDDRLFVKPTPAGRAFAGNLEEGVPYRGAKACLLVGADRWDEADWLAQLVRSTVAALPEAKPRDARAHRGSKYPRDG